MISSDAIDAQLSPVQLARRWQPEILKGFNKDSQHTAISDIRDSIAELRHYRAYMGIFSAC